MFMNSILGRSPLFDREQPRGSIKRLATMASMLTAVVTLISAPLHAQEAQPTQPTKTPPREASMLLKAGTIIEISYASIEGGKEKQLMGDYLPQIMPIVASYGGKMLGSFQVTAVTGGEVEPQMLAIFEWPSLEARTQLHQDKAAQKLFPLRDDALTYFKQAFYTVDQDTPLVFKENKSYEFFNAWLTIASTVSLPAYFKLSEGPKQKYGPPEFIAQLKPLENPPEGSYVISSDMAAIVEWNSTAAFYGLMADPGFKLAAPLLSASVSRLDQIHTKFAFPQ
ncbi:MAG: DUF1330 domain-containing protein [Halopseudomonas aestusnigri]